MHKQSCKVPPQIPLWLILAYFNDAKAGGRHHWVPEPAAALGKEKHKTLPGKARQYAALGEVPVPEG